MLDRSFDFMGHARDHVDIAGNIDDRRMRFLFPGDAVSVRSALASVMTSLRALNLKSQVQSVIEIVLAEVLNNVVEHAYADHAGGVIEIEIAREVDGFAFCVTDDGRPMPDNLLPEGVQHDLNVPMQDLPEGGYGWYLIRKLTVDLDYTRSATRNRLRFRIPLEARSRPN